MHRLARGALLLLFLAACGDDSPAGPDPAEVASVVVVAPADELALGDTLRLKAVALNAAGDTILGRPVAWVSSAPAVLEVTAAGRVIAHAGGPATITATVDGVDGTMALSGVALSFASVVAGDGVTCGLTAEGRAWCWGNVGAGGLGGSEGDSVFASVARAAGGALRFGGLSLRTGGGCGTLLAATAACWGTNASGQLGDGTTTNRPGPAAVPGLTGVAEVAAGPGHACARGAGGQVWCWGANDEGQLGDGTYAGRAVPGSVGGLAGVTRIGVGTVHSCALLGDGSARCWGSDGLNQLGHDTSYARATPQLLLGFQANAVAAGWAHTCALDQSGQAWCWGRRGYGSAEPAGFLGFVPAPVGGPAFTSIATGNYHSCGLTVAGAAWCWGRNDSGQLGDGSTTASATPVAVAGGHVFTQIGAGTAGVSGAGFTCALDVAGSAWCWGNNHQGQLGRPLAPLSDPLPGQVTGGHQFATLGVGDGFACGLTAAGEALCWGSGGDSQLGNGVRVSRDEPTPVAGGHAFASLHVGSDWGSCGIEASGQAWCWGQVAPGNGESYDEYGTPVAVGGGIQFASIAPGAHVTCGLDTGGATWCWGENEWGQLGTDAVAYAWTPVPAAAGRAFVGLAAGAFHVCGREADGATYCWGEGAAGQLGIGLRRDSPNPVTVDVGTGFDDLSVGGAGACGLAAAGHTCWGPYRPLMSPDFIQVSLSLDGGHGCGLQADGTAWCWGFNSRGQLGNGDLTVGATSTPVAVVGELAFASISAGFRHTCGVTTGGVTYCWGANAQGQLGAGVPRSTGEVASPMKVSGQ